MASEPQACNGCEARSRVTKAPARGPDVSAYAWLVFALTFGLLISDYMARQVLSAVFPLLRHWTSDW